MKSKDLKGKELDQFNRSFLHENSELEIIGQTLKNASLTKEQFIAKTLSLHQYTGGLQLLKHYVIALPKIRQTYQPLDMIPVTMALGFASNHARTQNLSNQEIDQIAAQSLKVKSLYDQLLNFENR